MTLTRGLAGAVILAALTLAAVAADPPRGGKKSQGQPVTEQDNKALAQLRQVTGTIVSTSPTDRSLTLRLEYQTLQPRPGAKGAAADKNQLYRRLQAARRSGNPLQQAAQMKQIMAQVQLSELRALQNSFQVVKEHKDFDLILVSRGHVRDQKVPFEYDDKGFPRKYTTKELEQMKGNDPSLPGYAADFEKLKAGDSVRVTLARESADDRKDRDKSDPRLRVSLVLILGEGPDPNPPKGGKKGK